MRFGKLQEHTTEYQKGFIEGGQKFADKLLREFKNQHPKENEFMQFISNEIVKWSSLSKTCGMGHKDVPSEFFTGEKRIETPYLNVLVQSKDNIENKNVKISEKRNDKLKDPCINCFGAAANECHFCERKMVFDEELRMKLML